VPRACAKHARSRVWERTCTLSAWYALACFHQYRHALSSYCTQRFSVCRYRPVINRWRRISSRTRLFETGLQAAFNRAALYRDTLMGVLLAWLCCHMFARDIRSFLDSLLRLRAKRATLTFLDSKSSSTESNNPRGGRDLWSDHVPGHDHADPTQPRVAPHGCHPSLAILATLRISLFLVLVQPSTLVLVPTFCTNALRSSQASSGRAREYPAYQNTTHTRTHTHTVPPRGHPTLFVSLTHLNPKP
jgi:hypothetical protein